MTVYIFCGISLVLLAVFVSIFKKKEQINGTAANNKVVSDGECCGKHAVCQKQRLAELAAKKELYYEDEELDKYAGRPSDSYNEQEIEEFRYVLNTLKPEEISQWLESLTVRGVTVPDELKDEAYMFL